MRTVFGLFLTTTILWADSPLKETKTPDYYPVKEGSTWEYTVTTTLSKEPTTELVKISKVSQKGDEITGREEGRKFTGEAICEVSVTPKGVILNQKTKTGSLEWTLWKTGAKKGDTWDCRMFLKGKLVASSSEVPYLTNSVVGEIEEVTVPAGKYKAQRVDVTMLTNNVGEKKRTINIKMWFADGVGIVRVETSSRLSPDAKEIVQVSELKKYTDGK